MKQKRIRSFRMHLALAILVIELPIVTAALVFDYYTTQNDVASGFALIENQAETDMRVSMRVLDESLKALGAALKPSFETAFVEFVDEYISAGSYPLLMNLTRVGELIGPGYDLYVINASAVVVCTTYLPDLGLDFSPWPDFVEALEGIRTGSIMVMDRILAETQSGFVRLYGYMPTPDHQYVLELGLLSDQFSSYLGELSYAKLAQDIANASSYIVRIRVLSSTGYQIGNSSFVPDSELIELVQVALTTREPIVIQDWERGIKKVFEAVFFIDDRFPTDASVVLEMVFDISMVTRALMVRSAESIILGALLAGILVGVTIVVAARITKPVHEIVKAVDDIAAGNLDREVSVTSDDEIESLEKSINTMVTSLKSISDRTLLYMDILCHDIRNWLQAILVSTELLSEQVQDERGSGLISKITEHVARCQDMIQRVNVAEQSLNEPIVKTDLRATLQPLLDQFRVIHPDVELREILFADHVSVWADSLLAECIWFVLENGVAHNKSDRKLVEVSLVGEKAGFALTVGDNGPGIPDSRKKELFEVKRRYGGVSLHIIHSSVGKYGGYVSIEDRVAGFPEKGAVFVMWVPARRERAT